MPLSYLFFLQRKNKIKYIKYYRTIFQVKAFFNFLIKLFRKLFKYVFIEKNSMFFYL